ncbi:MAG: hypothetical protein ACOYLX_13020 [Burkholderiaceae bacterium]
MRTRLGRSFALVVGTGLTGALGLVSLPAAAQSPAPPRAGATAGTSAPPGEAWPRAAFPDGSGSIAVPPGWRITSASRAAVEMQGPRAEGAALGITFAAGAAQFAQPGVMAGPYLPPPQAFVWVSEMIANKSGQSARARIVEVQQTAPLTQNGRAAYLLADQFVNGRPYRSFALVNTADLGNGYWQFYMSMVTAPAEAFGAALPQMLRIWHSWSISPGEMTRRTATAITTMKETHAIIQQTAEGRRLQEWHQLQTGMTLRGRWVVEDTVTGQRLECDSAQINALQQAYPGRFRSLGSSEIRTPGAANCTPPAR